MNFKSLIKKIYLNHKFISLFNYVGKPFKGRAVILCYHRVVSELDYTKTTGPLKNIMVTNESFDYQMDYINKNFEVISMDEMADHLLSESQDFKVAVTFDDGYKDNLVNALPILRNYRIPATVYLTTRFLEGDLNMWWYFLWETINKMKTLKFEYRSKVYKYNCRNSKEKSKAFFKISEIFKDVNINEHKVLFGALGNDYRKSGYETLCLKWNDVKKLNNSNLITIGSHTHNHLRLSSFKKDILISEFKESIDLIQKNINCKVKHFAFPFGAKEDINKAVIDVARNLGVVTAVSTRVYPIRKNFEILNLPRLHMRDESYLNLGPKMNGFDNLLYSIKNK